MQTWLPIIDVELCTACSLCITQCPTQAVGLVRDLPAIVKPEACVYCGLCEEICPTGAVSLTYEISL
jgi:formate hydrogenlyase subunit 6/NADH:ubiquinone oxidoreductase subunit I